ncbi:MFS general substrate transporter [Stipitochalara longipes BDJ]|nr:MFS general substrate transporter [Stipitochalara longipes BDJ]
MRAPSAERDYDIVDWDGPNDPENPLNWPRRKRVSHVVLVSVITFISPLASSMFAPAVPQLMAEFHSTNTELAAFVVSVYLIGYATGPLVIAPLSELYGRLYVYHINNILFIIFTIACAVSPSLSALIGFRFLAGCAGSSPVTLGGGTVADVIHLSNRGLAMSLYILGMLLGPVLGPVAGGFFAQAEGWRWIFWVLAIASGIATLGMMVLMRETYAPTILEEKARRLRKETGNSKLRSKLHTGRTPRTLFIQSIVRPAKMLFLSPIVLLLSTFMAIVYGYLYLLFTTIPAVFRDNYGFTSGTVGLAYLGIGLGAIAGVIVFACISDRLVKKLSTEGVMKPEYRLPVMMYGAPFIPVGLFWYGWSVEAHTHWIVPIIGSSFVGFGLICIFMPVQTYMVDAFTVHAASALAASSILRSLAGGLLPLAGQKMYANLGLGWGNSLLAFIALAMIPVPWSFFRKGESLRKRFEIKNL